MAADDNSGAKPAGPVVLRIKLRYDDVEAMVQRFAPNVGKSGLFLPTKSIQPIGTEIKFELKISDDTAVLVGLGRVKAARPPDPANPRTAFGIAIELMRVTREGREVIMRMLDRRRAMGLPDVAIPMPEDIDAARRSDVETQPRVDIAATVRDAAPDQRDSAPIAPIEQLLTAPRPGSGPIARAKGEPLRPSAPALAPEPSKAKRPRIADMIAKANESFGALATVAVPGLDEHVDVERALARARALAGGDVDTELAALLESSAAPNEISIEAASAELAKQLGGAPIVKRDRSARWAPPPAVGTTVTDADADSAAVAAADAAAADAVVTADAVAAAAANADAVVAAADAAAVPDPVAAPAAPTSKRRVESESKSASPPTPEVASEPASEVSGAPASSAKSDAAFPSASGSVSESVSGAPARSDVALPSASGSVSESASSSGSVAASASEPAPDPDPASDFRAPAVSDATVNSDTVDEHAHFEMGRAATGSSEMDQLAAEQAMAIATRGAGSVTAVDPEPTLSDVDESRSDPSVAHVTSPLPAAQPAMLIDDDADLASFENALDAARIHTGVAQAAPPADLPEDDEEQLDSLDLELAEETEIGELTAGRGPFDPETQDELANRLDQQLAAAEAEANSDFAIALQAAPQRAYETVDASEDFAEEEISDLDVLAEADAGDADLLSAHGERDASNSEAEAAEAAAAEAAEVAAAAEYDFAAQLDLGDETPPPIGGGSGAFYDRKLGELPPTASMGHQLGDYDPSYDTSSSTRSPKRCRRHYHHRRSTIHRGSRSPKTSTSHISSRRPLLRGPNPGRSARIARLRPPETFDEPHGFAANERDARANRSRPKLPSSPAMLHAPPRSSSPSDEDYDLEDALSTLDVDLDRLEIPRDPPSQPRGRPLPGMPPERAPVDVDTVRPGSNSSRVSLPTESPRSTKPPRAKRSVTEDEGVLIDFDDDE